MSAKLRFPVKSTLTKITISLNVTKYNKTLTFVVPKQSYKHYKVIGKALLSISNAYGV